ncbi:xylulokinase [Ethanoligenens sp.]|uniref:xylulokinase n=1 Tax=Ethanoligenens sp. TaxID=2099655 RepID=UPI0039EB80A1
MSYLLGIDVGTSGTKSVLFNEHGAVLASATREYPLYQPCNGWAEQDPDDWWDASVETVRSVLQTAAIQPADIAGVGISGQMHGLVLLDGKGNVLRKAILWCDQRTAAQCEEITWLVGRARLIEITANPALTGFTAGKILWVRENEPAIYEKCCHILLPKDYIRYKLTGEFATDVSDASGMQLLDVPGRKWADEVLEKLEIERSLLCRVYESAEVTGTVHRQAAEVTGLAFGTPVVGGAGDNAAAAVGTGVVRDGRAFTTIGTSGVVYAHSSGVRIDAKGRVHTFCSAVPGEWHVMGVTLAAGLSMSWFRDNFCAEERGRAESEGRNVYDVMDEEAAKVSPGCDRLLYLPYLMGERTPHLDPDCRGVFFGLSAMHTRAHLIRAVMEGVSFSLLDCMDILSQMGLDITEMRVTGGGGTSALWRQILCDMFGCPVCTVRSRQGPALGAALLAGVGTGIFSSVPQACDTVVACDKKEQPNYERGDFYAGYHVLYQQLYTALSAGYKQLGALS